MMTFVFKMMNWKGPRWTVRWGSEFIKIDEFRIENMDFASTMMTFVLNMTILIQMF